MDKFDSAVHSQLAQNLPFCYCSSIVYLDFATYIIERNHEKILVDQDPLFPHEFPALFLPSNKDNWQNMLLTFGTKDIIKEVEHEEIEIKVKKPITTEFYFHTGDFINPKGKLKNRINQFNRLYKYKVLNEYEKEKTKEFFFRWREQKDRSGITYSTSEKSFFFCLDRLEKYNISQVYVEIDNRLEGLAWGIEHQSGGWVGLHLKVNYDIKGLSRFLHHEREKMFRDREEFTVGTNVHDEGIGRFKKELNPKREVNYYYVITGGKVI